MQGDARGAAQLTVARYVICLGLFCLYVRFLVAPEIHFGAHPLLPIFYSNVPYLKEFLGYPAGPIQYVAGFLILAFHSPWGGPLLVTALAGLLCWAADVLVLALGGKVRELAFAPAVLLIVAMNQIMDQPTALVALTAAALCFVLYLGLAGLSDGRRIGLFLVSGVLLHYVAGGVFLLFALLTGLYELLVKRRRLPALVSLLSMEAVPYLGAQYIYEVGLIDSFRRWTPWDPAVGPGGPLVLLVGFFPLLLVGYALGRAIAARRTRAAAEAAPPRRKERRTPKVTGPARRAWVRPAIGLAVVVAVGAAAAFATFSPAVHQALVLDYRARQGDWPGVLRAARKLPPVCWTDVTNQHVNRALYETGRLGDEMFAYPQVAAWLVVDLNMGYTTAEQDAKMQRRTDLWFQIGDLDLRLGLVNEAEHEAHEALAIHGPHPEVLQRLALVNLVKGQPDAARVFLNLLRENPVYAREADSLLDRVAADPRLSADPEVSRVRAVQLTTQRACRFNELHLRCRNLLADHPRNRMAFEYLMASCLLRKDLAGFEGELPRMRRLGYQRLPRHYQEAILLYERSALRASERGGYAVSPEVLQSFADFSQALQSAGGDPRALAERFGDTYFFYHAFGVTGAVVPR